MRRKVVTAALIALLSFAAGMLLAGGDSTPKVIRNSSSIGVTHPERERMDGRYELFPSPDEAARLFDADLAASSGSSEFEPCFDDEGRRVGDRAVMLLMPPHVKQPTWRIAWTYRSADRSEYFMVESVSLDDARHFEADTPDIWKRCRPAAR